MVSACCEVDTIFRLWLSGLKVAGLEAYCHSGLSPISVSACRPWWRSAAPSQQTRLPGIDDRQPLNVQKIRHVACRQPQAAHPRDFSQDVNRKYSSSELIHTWSDLAGFTYDGFDPTRAITSPQFKETTRWIGNPYKKNALIDYDTLPYGDQIGNQ